MKLFCIISVLLIHSISIYCQQFYGMTKVSPNLWVDNTEITNNEYRQFVNYVKEATARELLFKEGFEEYGQYVNDGEIPENKKFKVNWDIPIKWKDSNQAKFLEHLYFPEVKQSVSEKEINHHELNYLYYTNVDGIQIEKTINVCPLRFNLQLKVSKNIGYPSLASTYFGNPVFDNFPVVGISYEQALAFCNWRTQITNNPNLNSTKHKVKFCLPTEKQWNLVAKSGNLGGSYAGTLNHPENPKVKREKKQIEKYGFLINSKEYTASRNPINKKRGKQEEWSFIVNPQHTFGFKTKYSKSNKDKIFGLAGNVAEMTQDFKILGGSWFHPLNKCLVGQNIEHNPNTPTNWLGFRCVVLIVSTTTENFDWLLGNWQRKNEKEGKETFESWTKKSNSEYLGFGFTTENKDTIWQENIKLIKTDENWNFEVTGDGEIKPTIFKLTKIEKEKFTCENKQNEFPTQIMYFKNGSQLEAIISGEEKEIPFEFEKIKSEL